MVGHRLALWAFVSQRDRFFRRLGLREKGPELRLRAFLVLEANAIVRHVQLNASFRGSKVNHAKINTLLANKPSGCVVFIWFDPATLELGPFAFFGRAPGQPLPDVAGMKICRHTKGNAQGVKAERPNMRKVPLSKFERLKTVEQAVSGCSVRRTTPQAA